MSRLRSRRVSLPWKLTAWACRQPVHGKTRCRSDWIPVQVSVSGVEKCVECPRQALLTLPTSM